MKKAETQCEDLAKELHELENEYIRLRVKFNRISEDNLIARTNLGDVINIVLEYGSPDLFDIIEKKVSFGEK